MTEARQNSRTVKTALIPVAGKGTRLFPATAAVPKALIPLTDVDGVARPVLHIILREAARAGIERFGVVVSPGQQELLRRHFRRHEEPLAGRWGAAAGDEARELADLAERIEYIEQPTPEGFGHAVWCGRRFVADRPFVLLLGDQVYAPLDPPADRAGALGPLLEIFAGLDAVSVTGVQLRGEGELSHHGVIAGEPAGMLPGASTMVFRVRDIVEKPDIETARRRLRTPAVPEGMYLTHAGAYVFDGAIMAVLDEMVAADSREGGEVQLTSAQQRLLEADRPYLAATLGGYMSYDVGVPAGLAEAGMGLSYRPAGQGER